MRHSLGMLVGVALGAALCWPQSTAVADRRYKVARKFLYPKTFSSGKPYSPGVLVGETLYVSGQVDRDPQTGAQPQGIVEQTRLAMANLGHVLRAAGMDYGNVVSCHVQLADKSKIAVVVPPAGSIPAAIGPYRPAVWAGDTLYVSGAGGRKPNTNEIDATIEGQTKQTMENIGQILSAAGLEHKDAVFTNVYFLDPAGYQGPTYGQLNSVYPDFFRLGTAPSRASFCVSKLPGAIRVEITYIATRDRANKGRVVPDSAGPSPTSSNGGVLAADTLYTSGKSASGATLEAQMRGSLESIRGILALAGMSLHHVVDAHVYLKDIGQIKATRSSKSTSPSIRPPARPSR